MRAIGVGTAASAVWIAMAMAPAHSAFACGSSGGGGGSSGGSGGGGSVVGSILSGIFSAIASGGGSHGSHREAREPSPARIEPRANDSNGEPIATDVTYTQGVDEQPAAPPPPPSDVPRDPSVPTVEAALGFAWATIDQSSLTWSGWQAHPILGQQVDSQNEASGDRLGLRRVTMMGASARMNVLLFDMLTLGPSFSFLQQVDENGIATPGSRAFRVERMHALEVGAQVGLLGRLGPVSLRAELFVGEQHGWATVLGLGTAGCDAPPVVTQDHWVLAPRAMITGAVSRNVTLGAYAGVDTLHFGDWSGGVTIAFQGGGFATPAPEMPIQ